MDSRITSGSDAFRKACQAIDCTVARVFFTRGSAHREEVLGQNFSFLMARGADSEALAQLEAEFEGSSDKMAASSGPPPSLALSEVSAVMSCSILSRRR
jgi:hypothetical protein